MNNKKNYLWQMQYLQNPDLRSGWPLYSGMKQGLIADLTSSCGHVCVRDGEYSAGAQVESCVAVAPIYVRDLAGRCINIGSGPNVKSEDEWKSGTENFFPRFATPEYGFSEQIFTSFRSLDASISMDARPSGAPKGAHYVAYKTPNLYPYKLRLDTFYIDGWKLPQTEYLYVKSDGVTLTETESSAAEFFAKWDERGSLTYEQWYEQSDGGTWFETLFEKGVTVIPTVEAHNGFNKVSANFELDEFWPGRAVSGLHKVIGMQPSKAPKGTILEVTRPGLAMSRRIEPAQVIVSDGSGYKSPHTSDPEAYLPDLRLPHTRSIAKWGACHLPTHPSHFEQPALWGWDKQTGKFMQLSGPLWDPLHYYYKSVDDVVRAMSKTTANTPVQVPEHLKLKFYPIETMQGYDVIDEGVYHSRRDRNLPFSSTIRRKPLDEESCTLGYHPLPLELEYELDNWWFPDLAPKNRLEDLVPSASHSRRLLPVIRSNVSPSYYAKEVEEQAWWISETENLKIATGRPLEDYPFLIRYLGEENDMNKIASWVTLHLEHIDDDILESSAYQMWPSDKSEDLEKVSPGFYTALMDMRSKGLDLMRFRHKLYRENKALYYAAFWTMIPVDELIQELSDMNETLKVEQKSQPQSEEYLLDQSNLKSSELGGSLDEDGNF